MASTRVYILAKELGVKSSAIVKKCQAEELNVKNHMSVISAGLAATIKEWFSESESKTAVETSETVDLKKVKIKKKKKRKKTIKVKKAVKKKKATKKVAKKKAKSKKTDKTRLTAEKAPGETQPGPDEKKVKKKKKKKTAKKTAKKKKTQKIAPAGPKLEKPEPAKLFGPEVIRVEKTEPPEKIKPPYRHKPRHIQKSAFDRNATQPLIHTREEREKLASTLDEKERKSLTKRNERSKKRARTRKRERQPEKAPKKPKPSKWRQRDIEERKARLDAAGGESLRLKPSRKIPTKKDKSSTLAPLKPQKATVTEPITVKDLSAALSVKSADIIAKLMQQDVMATANQTISNDAAQLVAIEFGNELTVTEKKRLEDQIKTDFQKRKRKKLLKKPPVVTMLGHVDHGKTSLLDKIRQTHVTDGEAGGITQHIGAYQVTFDNKKITFLDTPGHEAFTAMRARGANMTDIVVLVVAADDGVMPQTIEAIAHSKAAGVTILVALNKIDLPGCDINRIYAQLAEHELTPIEWGGDTDLVKTSALTGQGIDDLLEHIEYAAELLEIKADNNVPATGWVVEAEMSSTRGVVATLLVKEGKLKKADIILAGNAYGKIKNLKNCFGKIRTEAPSSTPVEITGLDEVPQAGDRFYVLEDLNKAKAAAEENRIYSREKSLSERNLVTLDNLFSQIEAGKVKELNLIIRADVQGSVDVLKKYLSQLNTDEVKIKILHAATGGITEGDVLLAEASNAIVIGFNVVADERVNKIAEETKVDIRTYNVIYHITEDLKKAMAGLLEPQKKQKHLGRAAVRQIFKISRVGTVAGCYVSSGVVKNNARVRLIRDNVVIRDGLQMESLKRFKNDAKEVKTGMECGIKLAKFNDVKVDDVLECYEIVKVERTLD